MPEHNHVRTFRGDLCDALDDWAESDRPFRWLLVGVGLGLGWAAFVVLLGAWLATHA